MSDGYTFTLDDETKRYAEEKLGENSVVREQCLAKIKEFLNDNPTLNARNDDMSILMFLRCCKFNIDKTKAKIKNFYEMRANVPEWFSNRDPNLPEMSELLKIGVFVPLTQTSSGPLIVIIRTGAHDPRRFKQSDVFKVGKMVLDLAVRQYESASIYGVRAIFDMRGVTYMHAAQLTPPVIKKAVYAWLNYHCRPQNLEFVNAPLYINVVLNVFRAFMTNKMKSRVHVHFSGYRELHKVIPKEVLPHEYGGTNGHLQTYIDYWRDRTLEQVAWFKEDDKYKADLN